MELHAETKTALDKTTAEKGRSVASRLFSVLILSIVALAFMVALVLSNRADAAPLSEAWRNIGLLFGVVVSGLVILYCGPLVLRAVEPDWAKRRALKEMIALYGVGASVVVIAALTVFGGG